ncbi:MAG: hypothetical protein J1E57_03165 [Prevotella sp.]|nr:hypothetical protein [Prevotella sp.]
MIKKTKIIAILFAFIMQTMHLVPLNASDVPLHYKRPPRVTPSHGPSKAPAKNYLTLNVFFDEESQQLTFSDLLDNVYTYYIYDDNKTIVSQGVLDFSTNESFIVNLWTCQSGMYTLVVTHNECTYFGTFDIDYTL